MKRWLLVPLVLTAAFASVQDETESQLWDRIQQRINAGLRREVREDLGRFLERHPKSANVPWALYWRAECADPKVDAERSAALADLDRLLKEFPESDAADAADRVSQKILGWAWSNLPDRLASGRQIRVLGRREGAMPATLTFYRLDDAALDRAADVPPDEWNAEAPREAWIRTDSVQLPAGRVAGEDDSFNVQVDVPDPGRYVVEEEVAGFRRRHPLRVGTFGVMIRAVGGRVMVLAADGGDSEPVPGASVRLRTASGSRELTTGADGLAVAELKERAIVRVRHGKFVDVFEAEPYSEAREARVYITTDRPIYRPGQTVHFKAVGRIREGAATKIAAGRPVRVEVVDPQMRVVRTLDLPWNEAGSLSGSLTLADEPPLGDYLVRVSLEPAGPEGERGEFWRHFTVAAYRKPEMRVTLTPPAVPPLGGERVKVALKAEYYFGGPVVDAEVLWEATALLRRKKSTEPRPPADESRRWFWDRREDDGDDWDWIESDDEADELAGSGRTGPDGTFMIEFDSRNFERPMRYTIQAGVRDVSNLTVESGVEIDTHPARLEVEAGLSTGFCTPGESLTAVARVVGLDGAPLPGRKVTVVAFLAREPEDWMEPYEFESFFQGETRTGNDGRARLPFTVEREGRIRVIVRAKDEAGRAAEARADGWCTGPQGGRQLDEIEAVPERLLYEEGETARFLVRIPEPGLRVLLTVESRASLDARIITLEKRSNVVEVPLARRHAPNAIVRLTSFGFGTTWAGGYEIFVYPKGRFIDVTVEADRPSYGPRENARVTVTTRIDGVPVAAEVELGVVDQSILALKPDDTPDIRTYFLPLWEEDAMEAGTLHWGDAFVARSGRSAALVGAAFSFEEEGGEADAAADFAATETRRWFPDTLHYAAHVKTDADGRAVVEIQTPDSLTEWRLAARAVSGAEAAGAAFGSTVTRKGVVVRLNAPRFLTERDSCVVTTAVHSFLPSEEEFTLRLTGQGVAVEGAERTVKVPAGGAAHVDWTVKAGAAGAATLRAEALSKTESDALELPVPIRAHGVERSATAAASVDGTWRTVLELPESADVATAKIEVFVTAPGLSAVREALPYLAGYPYGCAEQTMSRFLPSVAALDAMKRLGVDDPAFRARVGDMVEAGIQRLYGYQHEDGGWGWWKHDRTHPWMTAYVLYGLLTAKRAGFEVDGRTLERGLAALAVMDPTPFGAHVLWLGGDKDAAAEVTAEDDEGRAWLVLSGRREAAKDLTAGIPVSGGPRDIRRAALVIRALASVDSKDAGIATLVGWLMRQRRGPAWHSTLDSAHAVMALLAVAEREEEPAVSLKVNGTEVGSAPGRHAAPARRGRNEIEVSSSTRATFAAAIATWVEAGEDLRGEGRVKIVRRYERAVVLNGEKTWEPVEEGAAVSVRDELRVRLEITPQVDLEYVMIESPLPAGGEAREDEPEDWDWWDSWYQRRELRDDRVSVAAANLAAGRTSVFHHRLRLTNPGEYHVMPARAFAMYEPDVRGTGDEARFKVRP